MNLSALFKDIIIITGHYGTGKTNLAVNLALDLKRLGKEVAVADLDVVNPYFRTADFKALASANGIELIASPFANSNLDLPGLTGAFDAKIGSGQTLVLDVGGDDAGATALGRYAPKIKEHPYSMVCVVNRYRYLTSEPEQSAQMLAAIEATSRLSVSGIVNNSHLSTETTAQTVHSALDYASQTASLTGKPLLFSTVRRDLLPSMQLGYDWYPVDLYVKVPWA